MKKSYLKQCYGLVRQVVGIEIFFVVRPNCSICSCSIPNAMNDHIQMWIFLHVHVHTCGPTPWTWMAICVMVTPGHVPFCKSSWPSWELWEANVRPRIFCEIHCKEDAERCITSRDHPLTSAKRIFGTRYTRTAS